MNNFNIEGKVYKLSKKIGQGLTANVYKALSDDGKVVCVKIINQSFYKQKKGKILIDNQIQILKALNHSNILKFVKHQISQKNAIITQFCKGGTLYQYLQTSKKINEKQVLLIIKQIVQACMYLHKKKIIHRDLKPENIFFLDQQKKQIKIADFGFATHLNNKQLLHMNVGSPLYMPYQVLSNLIYSQQSDIFAIGVIWYELLCGKTPFQGSCQNQLKQKMKKQLIRQSFLTSNQKIKSIIKKCLSFQIKSRPTLSEILKIIKSQYENQDKTNTTNKLHISRFRNTVYTIQKKEEHSNLTHQKNNSDFRKSIDKFIVKHNRVSSFKSQQKTSQKTASSNRKISTKISERLTIKDNKSIDFKQALKRIQNKHLAFLPLSVENRLKHFILKYQSIFTEQKIQINQQQDQFITQFTQCNSQLQFCQSTRQFMRRLLRLAKTYKQNANNISDLTAIYNRIQKVITLKN